jgi:SAM-dependent methyltransferase
MRNFRKDWQVYQADKIPTKDKVPDYLYAFLERENVEKILDIGCGIGKLSLDLAQKGYSVTGVDINEDAIRLAKTHAEKFPLSKHQLKFLVGDAIRLDLDDSPFDAILLQLVISIIGTKKERERLIQRISFLLKPGGILYLSASGASDEINPRYAELYQKDLSRTGEMHSYFSRDSETGKVLYMTHHFSQEELEGLLKKDFGIEILNKEKETSSRRLTEPAHFFYVIARRRGIKKERS